MRAGTYRQDGVLERFTCGPDGDGWTYLATQEDLATGAMLGRLELGVRGSEVRGSEVQGSAGWGEARLHVEAGGWVLRAGTVGPDVLWRRGDQEREAVADGVTGSSPAYAVVIVHRLALEVGEERRLRLVAVTEPVLATRLVDQSWTRTGPDRYEVTDLATGERTALRMDAGLVQECPGLTLTQT